MGATRVLDGDHLVEIGDDYRKGSNIEGIIDDNERARESPADNHAAQTEASRAATFEEHACDDQHPKPGPRPQSLATILIALFCGLLALSSIAHNGNRELRVTLARNFSVDPLCSTDVFIANRTSPGEMSIRRAENAAEIYFDPVISKWIPIGEPPATTSFATATVKAREGIQFFCWGNTTETHQPQESDVPQRPEGWVAQRRARDWTKALSGPRPFDGGSSLAT